MKKCLILLTILAFFQSSFSQSRWNISGKVKSASSNAPLNAASVFISNSTKGTFTDTAGRFSISGLDNGTYNLIISSIGYETQVNQIVVNDKSINVTIAMKDTATELENIVITLKNGDRKDELKVFRKAFIGTDKNAKKTDILNEDILRIHSDESGKILTAHSNDFLVITNNALGYKIKFLLKEFSYNKKTTDLHYIGYPLFEEMKSNSAAQMHEWKENREKTYQSSSLRFFRSLGKRNLIQQGYILGDLTTPEVDRIAQSRGVANKPFIPSNGFLLTVQNQQYIDTLYWPEIPYYKIMTALPGHKYVLNFHGMISVDATDASGGANETDYYKPGARTSIVTLKGPVGINEDGLPEDPSKIIYYGYWMDLRIADLLPLDYNPSENKSPSLQ